MSSSRTQSAAVEHTLVLGDHGLARSGPGSRRCRDTRRRRATCRPRARAADQCRFVRDPVTRRQATRRAGVQRFIRTDRVERSHSVVQQYDVHSCSPGCLCNTSREPSPILGGTGAQPRAGTSDASSPPFRSAPSGDARHRSVRSSGGGGARPRPRPVRRNDRESRRPRARTDGGRSLAHLGEARQQRHDREIAIGMLGDPTLFGLAHVVSLRELRGELHTELRFVSGRGRNDARRRATASTTSRPRSSSTSARARIPCQRSRQPTCRRCRRARRWVRDRRRRRGRAPGEHIADAPVRRRPPPVEQPCLGQQERAGAHGGHAPRWVGRPADRVDEPPVAQRLNGAVAAGDDHRVEPPSQSAEAASAISPSPLIDSTRPAAWATTSTR